MKYQATIPETIVKVETKNGKLPQGAGISIFVPFKESIPIEPTPEPESPVNTPIPEPEPTPQETEDLEAIPEPTFDQIYENVEFRNKRFEIIGNAEVFGMSEQNWTIVLNVRFIRFDQVCRVIGSANNTSDAGSSLQIGVLPGGLFWVDTFKGGLTVSEKLNTNQWYQIAVCHNANGEEAIYIDGKLKTRGKIPVFKSNTNIYVGRWINQYFEFDCKRIRIYSKILSEEEIKSFD